MTFLYILNVFYFNMNVFFTSMLHRGWRAGAHSLKLCRLTGPVYLTLDLIGFDRPSSTTAVQSFISFQTWVFIYCANTHTHARTHARTHTHTDRDKVIAVSTPPQYVVGADNKQYCVCTSASTIHLQKNHSHSFCIRHQQRYESKLLWSETLNSEKTVIMRVYCLF